MGKLLLIRHVESQYGEGGDERSEGWRDVPPSQEGKKEAKRVSDDLADLPIVRVVASDLQRNKILGRAIAEKTGAKFETSRGLRSWNVGERAGRPRTENTKILNDYKKHPYRAIPSGESFATYVRRWLGEELPGLQESAEKLPEDEIVAAITHSHNIADAYEYVEGKTLKELPPTGSVWCLSKNGKGWRMAAFDPGDIDEDEEDDEDEDGKVSKLAAGYMMFEGGEEDTPCEVVEGLVDKELSCCNLFSKTARKVFSCGTCSHIG